MVAAKYSSNRKSLLFIVVGLIAFGLYLYYFVGIQELFDVLRTLNTGKYVFFYALAIACGMLALFFWTASWKTVLQMFSVRLKMGRAFLYFWVGYFFDLLFPSGTIASEVTRLYLIHNETKQDLGAIAASAIINRIVEYLMTAIGLTSSVIIALLLLSLPPLISDFLLLVLRGTLVYLTILLSLALKKKSAEFIVSIGLKLMQFLHLRRSKSAETAENTKKSLELFYQAFQTVRKSPRKLVRPFVYQLSYLTLSILVYVAVFEALGFRNISIGFLIIVYFIASSIQGATASFSVGSLDIILATVFNFNGMTPADSGIAVVVLRSVTYWIPLLIGYTVAQLVGARNIRLAGIGQKAMTLEEGKSWSFEEK